MNFFYGTESGFGVDRITLGRNNTAMVSVSSTVDRTDDEVIAITNRNGELNLEDLVLTVRVENAGRLTGDEIRNAALKRTAQILCSAAHSMMKTTSATSKLRRHSSRSRGD